MKLPKIKLATILGVPVYIDWSFYTIITFITITDFTNNGWMAAFRTLFFLLSAFTCVLFHEFAHILKAKEFGIKCEKVVLYIIGAVALIDNEFERSYKDIAKIAIVGPIVNLLFSIIFWISYLITGDELMEILTAVNLYIMLFNLIPYYPLDGGRILKFLIIKWYGEFKSESIHKRLNLYFFFGLLTYAFMTRNPILMIIALFFHLYNTSFLRKKDVLYRYIQIYITNKRTVNMKVIRVTKTEFELDTGDVYPINRSIKNRKT